MGDHKLHCTDFRDSERHNTVPAWVELAFSWFLGGDRR